MTKKANPSQWRQFQSRCKYLEQESNHLLKKALEIAETLSDDSLIQGTNSAVFDIQQALDAQKVMLDDSDKNKAKSDQANTDVNEANKRLRALVREVFQSLPGRDVA